MIGSFLSLAAAAVVPLLAQVVPPAHPPSPAPTLPPIGRVRATVPACVVTRDLVIPSFAAARRTDAAFAAAQQKLRKYVQIKDDDQLRHTPIYREGALAHLDTDLTTMMKEVYSMRTMLSDPRLQNSADKDVVAMHDQLVQLYGAEATRANVLYEYVTRERVDINKTDPNRQLGALAREAAARPRGGADADPRRDVPAGRNAEPARHRHERRPRDRRLGQRLRADGAHQRESGGEDVPADRPVLRRALGALRGRIGARQPSVDAALENVERQRAGAEHRLVKRAQIEPRAQRGASALAQLEDLELSDLVRARLARIGDVAVDLVHDVEPRLRRVVQEVRDRAVARPAERVHPGVDDQPHRAPHLVAERAELRFGVVVHADLVTERLRVQSPAF